MKKIMNILFASILALSLSAFAQAGELTVSGSAQATYTITSSDSATAQSDATPAMGFANEFTLGATGEFGNGYTWSYAIDLDPAQGSGAVLNDDTALVLGTPFGNIGIFQSEGDLNTHLANSVAAYAPGHDIGTGGGYQGGSGINGVNNIQYHSPAGLMPFGTVIKAAYSNGDNAGAADANDAGSGHKTAQSSYQVTTKPIDGLTVGASYLEKQDSGTSTKQKYETGGAYAKYSVGSFSFGIGRHLVAPNTNSGGTTSIAKTDALISSTSNNAVYSAANNGSTTINAAVEYFENDALSIAFAANENLSFSWDRLVSTAHAKQVDADARADVDVSRDLEITSIQAAYNIGGAVVALGQKSVDGVNYAQGKNITETVIAIKMAF